MSTDGSRISPVTVVARDGVAIPGAAGQQMTVKVSGAASRGAYSVIECSHAPGAPGPLAHLHWNHDETFYVIDGELTLAIGQFGESSVTVRAGQAAVVPRGVIHQPGNLSGHLVRFVIVNSPAMDDFFTELGQLVERSDGRPDAGDLRRLGGRHDTIFVALPAGTVVMREEGS